MAASTSHLYFMVLVFWGGCLVLQPCEANHCELEEVKNCTSTLVPELAFLRPVSYCPQDGLTCLENLETCTDITNIMNVFRYLCDNTTGVADTEAVNTCFSDNVKATAFMQEAGKCAVQSAWNDSLTGQQRCSAAATFGTCLKTAAESQCSGDVATRFYDKTKELILSYGCFKVERPSNQGGIMMPNQGMMAVTLGLTLMTLLFK